MNINRLAVPSKAGARREAARREIESGTRTTTIIESADGSKWTWAQQDRAYKTLAAAIKADDKRAAEVAARNGGKVVTVREIRPNTAAGALVARAFA